MQRQRAQEIAQAVESGLRRWRPSATFAPDMLAPDASSSALASNVIRSIPRRRLTHSIDATHVVLPMAHRVEFKPGIILPCFRLLVWLWAGIRFFFGNLLDVLRGRASIQRRAVRLREVFEQSGPSFAKLGQQLSLRADMLPYAYCAELSKLLDRAHPIPTTEAIAIIERSLGRKLDEIFESFDPDPIGSASLACVYQARLRSGEHVAVKVRRPRIGQVLSADLRALDWLLILAETLTLIRPNQTTELRRQLRKMLMGELNFRTEARYNEMFRIRTEKDGDGITAPRVFFQYCTDEVLVNELVSGVWMWELMAAVDSNDHEFLANLRTQGIEPGRVARRLIQALHRELLEHLFFHADPHPANLVVLPDSRICFIDFGAVGRFSTAIRNTWRELQIHMQNRDIERMVRASINLAGPLPPIDVDTLTTAMDEIFADWVYAVGSTDAEWWERSSAQSWLRYITVARQYGLPVAMQTIQFFRATFLYDTVIARLDKDIDPSQEWKKYARKVGKEARSRVNRQLQKRLGGPTRMDYLRIEQFADMAKQFIFQFQRAVEDPIFHFRYTVGKIAYVLSMVLQIAYAIIAFIALGLGAELVVEKWFGRELSWQTVVGRVLDSPWVQVTVLVILLVIIRRVLIRMNAPESKPDQGR
jgi:ubiquinone biosynthesis protein